jgi:hypothetical protein
MLHKLLTLLFCLAFIGCTEDSPNIDVSLYGKWVEVNDKVDTLTFNIIDGHEFMTLDRGKEVRDGFLLPKAGSGPYDYKILGNKISIYWLLSSNSAFNDYYFEKIGSQLKVENFYDESAIGTILTFEKVD